MKVIIAEKPSVAKNIADALNIKKRQNGYLEGDEYVVTWAFGHLLQLFDAKDYDSKYEKWLLGNFPIIPDEFKYKVKNDSKNKDKVDKGARDQLSIIKELINRKECVEVIHACDNDREGQIIGDVIFNYLKVKKPIQRLLLNEWTPDEVLNGLKNLKSNKDLINVSSAGISRQWADWLIGINLTSVATLLYKKREKGVLNIGRVILPTLKIIYDRDIEIEKFVKNSYFKLSADFITNKNEIYQASYFNGNEDKFKTKEELKDIEKKLKNKTGLVAKKETVNKKEYAPYLFNLTNLQGHITNKYRGWTSDKVLKIAQSLYEKKFTTYPRTASVVLEESLAGRAEKVLNVLKKGLTYENEIKFIKSKRVFDNKKVDGHSAIIPTYLKPTGLTKDEEIVYNEIRDRFIMQFMPVSEYDETTIITKVDDVKGEFVTKGKTITVMGWKKVQGVDSKEVILPNVVENEVVNINNYKVTTHTTQPPKHHTEQTLLKVMESCGKSYKEEDSEEMMDAILSGFSIGTPATRAEAINKLRRANYIETKGKSLLVSPLGRSLVESFPINELLDLEYTGRLEKTLSEIEKGKIDKDDFLNLIYKFTRESVDKIKRNGGVNLSDNIEKEALGTCPECGEPVIENDRNYGCSSYAKTGCKFAIWKNDRFLGSMKKEPTMDMVRKLLKNGEVEVNGLISKKGNKFDAILSYKKNNDTGYYNWDMNFPERK